MAEKIDWLPIDTSLLPLDLPLKYPKSKLIRVALYLELILALVSVFGTLLLTIFPASKNPLWQNQLPVQTPMISGQASPKVP